VTWVGDRKALPHQLNGKSSNINHMVLKHMYPNVTATKEIPYKDILMVMDCDHLVEPEFFAKCCSVMLDRDVAVRASSSSLCALHLRPAPLALLQGCRLGERLCLGGVWLEGSAASNCCTCAMARAASDVGVHIDTCSHDTPSWLLCSLSLCNTPVWLQHPHGVSQAALSLFGNTSAAAGVSCASELPQ
jgi:hypothetical protein